MRDADRHRQRDGHSDRDSHRDTKAYGYRNADGYGNTERYSNCDIDRLRNRDSLGHTYCDGHTRHVVSVACEPEIRRSESWFDESRQGSEGDQQRRRFGEVYRDARYW